MNNYGGVALWEFINPVASSLIKREFCVIHFFIKFPQPLNFDLRLAVLKIFRIFYTRYS